MAMVHPKKMKILWLWQSNNHPWSPSEEEEWSPYSDKETKILVMMHQKEKLTIELNQYIINLGDCVQISKHDPSKRRPIMRLIVEQNQYYLRRQRFCIPQIPSNNTFVEYRHTGQWPFSYEWWRHNECSYTDQVEQAAVGIITEGEKLGETNQATMIANALRSVKHKGWSKVARCCVLQFTRETFLYKLINKTLREGDWSKVKTLGPFCHLLSTADSASDLVNNHRFKGLIYRGMNLTTAQVQSYKSAIGQGLKSWLNFSSTSRSRAMAERFGNTLLIIDLRSDYHGLHIASISRYPKEDEVLLRASQNFWVAEVKYDENSRKHHIYVVIDGICS